MEDRGTQLCITQKQLPGNTPLPDAFFPDTTVIQGPIMWQQSRVHFPYLGMARGHFTQSAHKRLHANQFLRSAPYWVLHPNLPSDQPSAHAWPEVCHRAHPAGPWLYTLRSADARALPCPPTGLPQPSLSFSHQAGDSSSLAAWQQAAGPLLQGPGPGRTTLTQVSGRHLQGVGDSLLSNTTSLEEAMRIFHCEPQAKQASLVEDETTQKVLDVVPPAYTVDHSLDHVDLEACLLGLLEAQASDEAGVTPAAAAEDSGMEFFYEVDRRGYLCDLQLFGETVSSGTEGDVGHMEF